MQNRFKFRIPMFTDKGTFMEFQYLELGDFIECTLCGKNGEPQQCTGLKDKNGKLIYEGDICRHSKSGEVFNVVWHNPLASFCWQKHEHSRIYSYGELFRAFDYYEVIGNIYENEELLNGNR